MNLAFERLVSLVRQGIGLEIAVPPLGEQEMETWSMAKEHKVATILAPAILDHPESPKLEDEARYLWQMAAMREEYYVRCLREIEELLNPEGIRVYPLKGVELARSVYPRKGQRAFRDLDLLVSPSDLIQADQILQRNGFQVLHPKGPLKRAVLTQGNQLLAAYRGLDAVSYEKDDLFLELHCTILPISYGPYRIQHVWDEQRLSVEDFFMHLLFHTTRHHFLYGLRQLTDLALWARHKEPNMEVVEKKLVREGHLPLAWPAWKLANECFPEAVSLPKLNPSPRVRRYTERIWAIFPEIPERAIGFSGSPLPFLLAKGNLWRAFWGRSFQMDHQVGDRPAFLKRLWWKVTRPLALLWRHAPVMWQWYKFYR